MLIITAVLLFSAGCGKPSNVTATSTPPAREAISSPAPAATATSAPASECAPTQVPEPHYVDIYAFNDLHGKIKDSDGQPGVDELTTYLQIHQMLSDGFVLLASGDMWQGSSESNQTKGALMTEWMNEMGFSAMVLGNHEFDWGSDLIKSIGSNADFPFRAINVYDKATKERVDWCLPSLLVRENNITIGIIGAIGDCYSSISGDKSQDVYFLVGDELTKLVKQESEKLRSQGADFIIYSLHDGYGKSVSGTGRIDAFGLSPYYDLSLSEGYVDLCFEAHTHKAYVLQDRLGVYHIQAGGDNSTGISHAQIVMDLDGKVTVTEAGLIERADFISSPGSDLVQKLLDKYADTIGDITAVLGINDSYMGADELRQLCADLYFDTGLERWGDKYDIACGGGYFSCRSPRCLDAGEVTYEELQMLFPFDNTIVLCSTTGVHLNNNFFATQNDNYFITYGDYGEYVMNNLNPNGTYYLVTDTYTSQYEPNHLTVIETYDTDTFARDLLADYFKNR